MRNILLVLFLVLNILTYTQAIELTKKEKEFIKNHPIIKIAGTTDSAPTLMKNPDGTFSGIDIDTAKLIYEKTGLKIVFEDNLWYESVQKAINKQVDGLSASVYNKERKKYFNFSRHYLKSTPKVFVKKGNPLNIKNIDDIKGKNIAIRKGTLAIEKFAKKLNNKIIYKNTSIEMIQSLISGEADFFIFFDNIEFIADKEGIDYIDVAFTLGKAREIIFSLRNDWPELISIVNKALDDIPEYQKVEIRRKWFSTQEIKVALNEKEKLYLDKKQIIKMCIDPNWMPFERINKKGEHIGISADILKEIKKNSDIKFKLIPSKTWEETLKLAKNRTCDMILLAMESKNRKEYMDFTKSYVSFPFVIATKNSQIFIDNMEALYNKKVALVKGYAHVELMREKYPHIQITEVSNILEGLQKVREGEVFGYIDALASIAYTIQKEGMTDTKIAGKFNDEWMLSIATRNDEPILNSIMQKAQDSVNEETKQLIYNKWLAIKFEERINYTIIYQILGVAFLLMLFGIWKYYVEKKTNKLMQYKNKQLKKAYEQYSWLAENMDDVVWVMDKEGKFIYISPSVEKLRGFNVEEIKEQSFEEVICESSRQKVLDEMALGVEAAKRGETPPSRTLRVEQPCKDGSTVWTEVNSRLIVDKKTNDMRFIGLTRDITLQKKLEDDLILAKEKAEEATKIKSEFLANMSHEIRTPMNGILGLSALLLKSELKDQQKEYLKRLDYSAKSLLGIINDILDFSKMEAKKLDMENYSFKLIDLLNSIKNIFALKLKEKNIDLVFNMDDQIPKILIGDNLRLQQIFNNLIGNAIKFTNGGKIYINVEQLERSENNITLKFLVEDTGIGISKKDQEKLFIPFTQADNSDSRKYEGTGLGLTITKQIVELMGGKIWMQSDEGKGSRFYFTIKLNYNENIKISTQNKKQKTRLKAKGEVLVVEDNDINQILIKEHLQRYGLNIHIAANGLESLKMIESKSYDLVFMDIQMPVMDGITATKKIRKKNTQIPIIALSAAVMQKDKQQTIEAGMNYHISKPIDWKEVEEVLKKYLDTNYINISKKENMDNPNLEIDSFDLSKTIKLLDLDTQKTYELLENFKNSYKDFDDKIKNISKEDLEKYIHKLKGISGNLQLQELYELTQNIELSQEENIQVLTKKLSKKITHICEDIQNHISPRIKRKNLGNSNSSKLIDQLIINIDNFEFIESKKIDELLNSLNNNRKIKEDIKTYFDKNDYDNLKELLEKLKK